MTGVFGADYAAAYDTLYQEKDYEAECDLIEAAARRFGSREPQSVLDLGCGTGGHAIPLSRRGHLVVGIDRSEDMLVTARRKAADEGLAIRFGQGDLRDIRLDERFDVVAMMFAVLGYQLGDDDVTAALATCRAHLHPGGVLVFDAWHGPAVLAERPSERVRRLTTEHGELERISSGTLDEQLDLCTVRMHVIERDTGGGVRETVEEHAMRYFFPARLATQLRAAGLEPMLFSAFPALDREPGEADWTFVGVARAG